MDLSIIIVSWKVKNLLEKCLYSIFQETNDIDFEVFVVDNDSEDGTEEMVKKKFPQVNLLVNKENNGFSKANNQGLSKARGSYILFMNPDIEIKEKALEKMVNFMKNNPRIGLSTCALVYPDNSFQPNIKNNPDFFSQFLILLKLHHLFLWPSLKKYLRKDFDYSREQEVDQIMGSFVLIKKEIINKLNGWDEDYWLLWEDIDLCKRIQYLGEKIVYTPIAKIVHHESRSFAQNKSLLRQKRFNKGMLIYFKKHHSLLAYWGLKLIIPLSLFLAYLTQIFKIKMRPQSKI